MKHKISPKRLRNTLCFVGPAFVVHAAVVTVPALSMLYYAFTDWNGLSSPEWTGLDNVRRMLADQQLHRAFLHTLAWTAIFLTVPIVMGLLVGILVTKTKKAQMVYRTIIFLPYVLSAVVAGKIWVTLYNLYFGLPEVFRSLGLEKLGSVQFLGNSRIALLSVAFVDNWHWWGFVMVLMLSALHQIDPALYEVGDLEGANAWQRLRYITVPQIRPALLSVLMLSTMWSFLTFDYVYIMTQGGPGGATEILATYIYKQAYTNFNTGYSNTISLFACLICSLVYFVFRALQRKGWDV